MAESAHQTQEEFARLVGISQPEVSQLIRKGVLTKGGSRAQWHKEYLDNLRKVAAGWQSQDGRIDRMQEAALLDRRRREELEIKIAEKKGELLPIPAVAAAFEFIISSIRSKLLSLPNTCRSKNPQLTPRQYTQIEEAVHDILTDLSGTKLPPNLSAIAEQYFQSLHATAATADQPMGRRQSHAQSRK